MTNKLNQDIDLGFLMQVADHIQASNLVTLLTDNGIPAMSKATEVTDIKRLRSGEGAVHLVEIYASKNLINKAHQIVASYQEQLSETSTEEDLAFEAAKAHYIRGRNLKENLIYGGILLALVGVALVFVLNVNQIIQGGF